MAINTLGFVSDLGGLRVLPCWTEGVVSGGAWLLAGSYTSVVTSADPTAMYRRDLVKVSQGGSGLNCVGLAMYTAGSNQPMAALLQGLCIVGAVGNNNAGRQLEAAGEDAAGGLSASVTGANAGRSVGRCLTEGASGGFCLAYVNISG